MRIPVLGLHFLQIHLHYQLHHEERLEEPSKIHPQTLIPCVYYFEEYHLQDTEKLIFGHAGSNEIVGPMFQQLVLLYSCGKYTNVTKLRIIKDTHKAKKEKK